MQENAPRKTSHDLTRLKHLNNIVMLASDAESYIRRDDKDPSRPKNGVIIFLDTEHIHRLDDMIEMCSQYKDLDIKLCNHPGCDKKAKFGTPYSSRDPVACVEQREETLPYEMRYIIVPEKMYCKGRHYVSMYWTFVF